MLTPGLAGPVEPVSAKVVGDASNGADSEPPGVAVSGDVVAERT